MEPGAESPIGEVESKEATVSALIRHLAAHAQYEAALLFTRGQYVLYYHSGVELICKGLSAQTATSALAVIVPRWSAGRRWMRLGGSFFTPHSMPTWSKENRRPSLATCAVSWWPLLHRRSRTTRKMTSGPLSGASPSAI